MNCSETKKRSFDAAPDGVVYNISDKVRLRRDCGLKLKQGNVGFVVDRYGEPPTEYVVEFPKQEASAMISDIYLSLVTPKNKTVNR